MVLAAALISVAVLASQAPAAPAPQTVAQATPQTVAQAASTDGSKPYSLDSVRRSTTAGDRPSIDYNSAEQTLRGYGVAIDSRAIQPDPCTLVISACQPAWRGGAYPTWNDQFLAMTGPPNYAVPYSAMSNLQTLEAVASSIAINFALQAVVSLIHDEIVQMRADARQKKIERVRSEIRAELDELERANAAARAAGQTAVK
jgi:hypothetical protein